MEAHETSLYNTISIKEFIDCNFKYPKKLYIHTFRGFEEVSHVRWPETNPWIVCPKSNGGFGISYCVHYGERLYYKND